VVYFWFMVDLQLGEERGGKNFNPPHRCETD
jgi:hypothetical protein